MVRWLTPAAQIERWPQRLIETLLAELVVHWARAAAARVTWRALAGDLTAAQAGALEYMREGDTLVV